MMNNNLMMWMKETDLINKNPELTITKQDMPQIELLQDDNAVKSSFF